MARAELCIKVGDNQLAWSHPRHVWRDGMVVDVRPPGQWISPAEFRAWLDDGEEPSCLRLVNQNCRRRFRMRIREMRFLTKEASPESARAIRWADEDPLRLPPETTALDFRRARSNWSKRRADAKKHIDNAHREVYLAGEHGIDTNWGWVDRVHFALIVVDTDFDTVEDMLWDPFDEGAHPFARKSEPARRIVRVAYEDLMPSEDLAIVRDALAVATINRDSQPLDIRDHVQYLRLPLGPPVEATAPAHADHIH